MKSIKRKVKTTHVIYQRDARDLSIVPDSSVHLVITSPPYWNLKQYPRAKGQLGNLDAYRAFIEEINKVWKECFRVLVPGGRLVCVVGDVCLARRRNHGRHVVVPLHADICIACREMGFDNLNPIVWYKIANASYEAKRVGRFLGKPYEPNGIIKNDIEFILMQRKPGGYRSPTMRQRKQSRIEKNDFSEWFQQIWRLPGTSTTEHPAPFPLNLAHRLIRMFTFVGDTVLDPFAGSGTSLLAAMEAGRNSIGIEVERIYAELAVRRMRAAKEKLAIKGGVEIRAHRWSEPQFITRLFRL